MNVLALVAHGDDEVLGCGGTLAKHAANKDDVYLIVLADGVSSRLMRTRQGEIRPFVKAVKSSGLTCWLSSTSRITSWTITRCSS